MLNLYRRHVEACGHNLRRFKKCTCPVWVQGSLHGTWMKKSMKTRNWAYAQGQIAEWESGKKTQSISVEAAMERYLADCVAQGRTWETMRKYRLLGREIVEQFGALPVNGVSLDALSAYRETWKLSAVTAQKKVERVRAFFNFCIARKWCEDNPAKSLKSPKVKPTQAVPFEDEEIEAIMKAIEGYPDFPRGRRKQLWAFVLLLRYSGLRIQDAITISTDRISDGNLMMPTQKTGQVVWLPLPEVVLESLEGLGERPFFRGTGGIRSVTSNWQRALESLFKRAGVVGSAHKFRHYFSVKLLSRGVSIEDVAILLGHSSPAITNKHYSAWAKVRQDRLALAVRGTF